MTFIDDALEKWDEKKGEGDRFTWNDTIQIGMGDL